MPGPQPQDGVAGARVAGARLAAGPDEPRLLRAGVAAAGHQGRLVLPGDDRSRGLPHHAAGRRADHAGGLHDAKGHDAPARGRRPARYAVRRSLLAVRVAADLPRRGGEQLLHSGSEQLLRPSGELLLRPSGERLLRPGGERLLRPAAGRGAARGLVPRKTRRPGDDRACGGQSSLPLGGAAASAAAPEFVRSGAAHRWAASRWCRRRAAFPSSAAAEWPECGWRSADLQPAAACRGNSWRLGDAC
mmetsp:Transcript_88292/g.191095  ORF Transcript_88292/g.191095 Transcript_88292/m.191095 type:complete len:246 (-) Transcript_88292:164-901(-)